MICRRQAIHNHRTYFERGLTIYLMTLRFASSFPCFVWLSAPLRFGFFITTLMTTNLYHHRPHLRPSSSSSSSLIASLSLIVLSLTLSPPSSLPSSHTLHPPHPYLTINTVASALSFPTLFSSLPSSTLFVLIRLIISFQFRRTFGGRSTSKPQ